MLGFLFQELAELHFDEDALGTLPANAGEIVSAAAKALAELNDFKTEQIQAALSAALVEGLGEKPKNAFGPVRVAISGRRVTPPLFECMEILGKAESLARLEAFAQSH
jgi:glutamyl-tRNA synthetase